MTASLVDVTRRSLLALPVAGLAGCISSPVAQGPGAGSGKDAAAAAEGVGAAEEEARTAAIVVVVVVAGAPAVGG